MWNFSEINEVAGEKRGIMHQGDGSNLQIHGSNAYPEPLELCGCFVIEIKHSNRPIILEMSLQASVRGRFLVDIL
jgi:hypothetical protein